jgi:glutamate carboxypeptidase
MPELLDLREELQPRLDEILDLTAALVAVDSGSHDPDGVDAVGSLVAAPLRSLGFEVRRRPVSGRGTLLDAELRLGPGPTVLVLGHADTVWPAGTVAEWPFTNDGEWLRGPGVGDMKCALAMAVTAISAAVRQGVSGIRFVLVPDEELSSSGSRPLLEAMAPEVDACLTLEGGLPGGGMIAARGAVVAVVLEATGRTAHCTEPGGVSALSVLAPLVGAFERLSDPAAGTRCSVGILRAGTARQVVPGSGELHLDLRAPDDATARALLARVEALIGTASAGDIKLETRTVFRPGLPAAVSAPVYAVAERLHREAGLPLRPITEKGGSDGSFLAAAGVPTLDGLGPVATEQCSRREAVEIASIVPRTAVLTALLRHADEYSRGRQRC